jgi:oxygen-independent coproporphyrinogen-3 oxidase
MIDAFPPVSIYIHIPFCTVRCTYCAFNTYINLETLIEPFTNSLITEIEHLARINPGLRVHTLYLGGGTPSLLSIDQVGRILKTVRNGFEMNGHVEISMEGNPDDIHKDYVQGLMGEGVNRLSLGMQSANNHELSLFGRRHDSDTVYKAVSAVRQAHMDNLNLDLIFAVPHQTLRDWEASLMQVMALRPDHLSLYALGLEEGTAMESWVAKGKLPQPEDDLVADMYELATAILAEHQYIQYEISNWSLAGKSCRHNEQYWLNQPYIGVGPGAHGYISGIRYETVLSPHRYVGLLSQADFSAHSFPLTPAVNKWFQVDRSVEIAETLLMGLRLTQHGVSRSAFQERFGVDVMDVHDQTLGKFIDTGLLALTDEWLCLTHQGRFLSNMIFRELV